MQDNGDFFPQNIYLKHLAVIHNVHFTRREIDVMACLLSGRGTSKIASLLGIAPSTVVTHIHNIMVKLECNSREKIIDFIEHSHKISLIREYYTSLKSYLAFEKSLQGISKIKKEMNFIRLGIYWNHPALQQALLLHLEDHLKKVGIKAKVQNQILNHKLKKHKPFKGVLLLLLQKEQHQKISKKLIDFEFIDLQEQKNYYFCVFDILKKLLPNTHLESIISAFKQVEQAGGSLSEKVNSQLESTSFKEVRGKTFSLSKRIRYFLSFLFFIGILGFSFFYQQNQAHKDSLPQPVFSSIRSDLFVPSQSILLHRPDEMAQIEEKLKGDKSIQTIALVGPGGIGKTTLSRQYARLQKAKIIWEVNAETYESLKSSFEDLAHALAITEIDQKTLAELQDIKDPMRREKKFIEFVRRSLKSHSSWFLIYDNVKEFQDIQRYFPQDPETWGCGKIILTTQNSNIQNSKHINSIIKISELNPSQKLTLFTKIMVNERKDTFVLSQVEETKQFLLIIPPYPLDISIAAYYLKATHVAYDKYLKYLGKGDIDFENIRENILKEAENYKKTRYHIVTLSLKQLMETHKDFGDLLLFICLLDSQDIPIDLLEFYKNEVTVSNFIYHLKKYSLITDNHQSLLAGKTITLHESTQKIGLTYLAKLLNLEKSPHWQKEFATVLEKYSAEAIDREDLSRIRLLISHCESFLKHACLLTDQRREIFRGELGWMYFHTGHYSKARKILEESLAYFNKNEKEYTHAMAHILIYLSHIYNQLTEYAKAKRLLEKGLLIYKKGPPQDYGRVAQLLANLGRLEGALFNIEKSRDLLEKGLILYEKKCPNSHLKRAEVLISLGNVYRELGDYINAKESLQQSLLFFRERYPKTHIKNAGSLTRLGNVYRSLGHYNKAKELLEESFALYKETYPENHSSIAWASTHLGNVYHKLGHYEKAKHLLEQSHYIYKTYFNENHIANAWVLTHLGKTYQVLGDNEKAKAAFEKGYDIYKAHNVSLAWPAAHLGNFYRERGQYDKANEFLNQSFTHYKKGKFNKSIRRALILRYLGNYHRDLQDYKTAKALLEESRDLYVKIQNKDALEIALVLWDLGKVYFLEGNLDMAENLMRKAFNVFQQNSHPDAYLILEDLSLIERKKK